MLNLNSDESRNLHVEFKEGLKVDHIVEPVNDNPMWLDDESDVTDSPHFNNTVHYDEKRNIFATVNLSRSFTLHKLWKEAQNNVSDHFIYYVYINSV